MTPIQRMTVNDLKAQGFAVVETNKDIVRLTRGADARLVKQDGTQMRANHFLSNVQIARGAV